MGTTPFCPYFAGANTLQGNSSVVKACLIFSAVSAPRFVMATMAIPLENIFNALTKASSELGVIELTVIVSLGVQDFSHEDESCLLYSCVCSFPNYVAQSAPDDFLFWPGSL